jgi:uncharacterized repeat protein (TIGR03803 family)
MKVVAILAVVVLLTVGAWAQTGTVLYSFTGKPDGANPHSSLVLDPKGNLFGTTNSGGAYGQGSVYELTPNASGGWTESVIYSFNYGAGGYLPSSNVIRDTKGNLYSTVFYGGDYGAGAVFELTRNRKTLERPHLRQSRQSLRSHRGGWSLWTGRGLRVESQRKRWLDGDGVT